MRLRHVARVEAASAGSPPPIAQADRRCRLWNRSSWGIRIVRRAVECVAVTALCLHGGRCRHVWLRAVQDQPGLPDELRDSTAGDQGQAGLAATLANRLIRPTQKSRDSLHWQFANTAKKMGCGSSHLNDTAALRRRLKRVERDARKLRKGYQYFECVLSASRTHRYAVPDPRASALTRCLRGGSGCAKLPGAWWM